MTNFNNDHLQQIVQFIMEIDKLKSITRKVRPLTNDRYENSAEHSWQISVLALSLEKYCDTHINISRVIKMLLIHDIGEIDTGDTMFFVEGGWEERKALELEAANRIFGILPTPVHQEFLALWKEFESGESGDAQFANAIDRVMPVLLNLENSGQSWKENNITYERVISRIEPPIRTGFPALWDYLKVRLEEARQKGYFGD